MGTPVTDSQKLLARGAALTSTCSQLTSTACTASSNCTYYNATGECGITESYINETWLRGAVYCPGSLADLGQSCTDLASQAACTANPNCNWNPAPSFISLASTVLAIISSWPIPSSGNTFSGACSPKWATDIGLLTAALAARVNQTLSAAWSPVASSMSYFTGVCPGSVNYLSLYSLCSVGTGQVPCVSTPGCAWGAAGCELAPDYAVQLLANASDPWIQAYRRAVNACGVLTTSTSCLGLATITVDPAKMTDYLSLQYTFPVVEVNLTTSGNGTGSAATIAPSLSLYVSLLAAVACLWALLL